MHLFTVIYTHIMILYVNGDSHTAAAEAVNPHGWEGDDGNLDAASKRPHPDNLAVSWGKHLADMLRMTLVCDAQAGGSNPRMIRLVNKWLSENPHDDVFMILQWSTWEREEWVIDGEIYEVNASGLDHVPESARQRYKEFIINIDWTETAKRAHQEVWDLHVKLQNLNIPHLFFNGNMSFSVGGPIENFPWGRSYLNPYTCAGSYGEILKSAGFGTRPPGYYHFGPDGHCFWAKYLLQYIKDHRLLPNYEIPLD